MLRLLSPSDSELIQPVFDACTDYALVQDGQPFPANAAELEFEDLPPGFTKESKRTFAIEQPNEEVVGLIAGVRGYPKSGIWFIGLMLIVPSARSNGLGTLALAALERYARSQDDCTGVELAVLKVNHKGFQFWERHGFCHRREAPAASFGQQVHERWVLGKDLNDA